MQDTTNAEGAQPLPSTSDTAAQSPESSTPVAASTPSVETPAATPSPSDTPPENDTRPILRASATVDEIIAAVPLEVLDRMTAKEVEALASGNPEAVAKVVRIEPVAKPSKTQEQTNTDESAEDKGPNGPNRISLKKLSPKDRKAVADAVTAIQEGKFSSFEEARTSLSSTKTDNETPAESTPAKPEPVASPKVTELEAKITQLKADKKAAAESYDSIKADEIGDELLEARLELADAKREHETQQSAAQSWATEEATHLDTVRTQYADLLANPEFTSALQDAKDLAILRKDPVMNQPDWAVKLAEKASKSFKREVSQQRPTAPFPTPPAKETSARGAVSVPSTNGGPVMSMDEATKALDGMSEAELDAVIASMAAKEQAAKVRR